MHNVASAPIDLFCLHFLGGSAREWAGVADRLGPATRCIPIDLPGFGDAAEVAGYTVSEMADHVAARIRTVAPIRFALAGHSMGAKVALALARRAEDGEAGLEGLTGLVLIAGSPSGPEPMSDDKRAEMLAWFRDGAEASRRQAEGFVAQNVGTGLTPDPHTLAVDDVLRLNRAAWCAWLGSGSREDWRMRIGVLATPALLLTGSEDADLGAEAQAKHTVPHLAHVTQVVLDGAGHLLPLERPDDVAEHIAAYLSTLESASAAALEIPPAYRSLIQSDRVNERLRTALLHRADPDDPDYHPQVLDVQAFALLRALLARIVPQAGPGRIDIAARIDRALASEMGDGWRYVQLPPDAEAYRRGLRTLDAATRAATGCSFLELDGAEQDRMIAAIGEEISGSDVLPGPAMTLWFEDLRADAVKIYLAHPATLAALGFSGIGAGGDQLVLHGFIAVGLGEREAWEPAARDGSTQAETVR
ncbi:alpha/beta fold hydrolase [Methylobacterium sp. WL9]|uniref:alpha/beta hydrolase n=1 Tax=Methylobacterium sp. WL9 TaxID=2603898 RepID=UPI0011CCA367|nr:alpha/beta fold hydrolase [Methylobacterium sp. WL9]TXN21273.1 alpha/beta fold hydrolase [Methylobacterium sp. WL9]